MDSGQRMGNAIMTTESATHIYLLANSQRARNKLPASAVCYTEYLPKGRGVLPSRYVYRLPMADFYPAMIGGSYHGKISKARVVEENTRKCW